MAVVVAVVLILVPRVTAYDATRSLRFGAGCAAYHRSISVDAREQQRPASYSAIRGTRIDKDLYYSEIGLKQ